MKKLGLLVGTFLVSIALIAPAALANDWSGPYYGAQGGFIGGDADTNSWHTDPLDTHAFSLNGFDVDGFAVGIFGGYMWWFGNDIVIGIEGEGNWPLADDIIIVDIGGGDSYGAEIEQEWDASLRLRAGMLVREYMFYITGGIAWAGTNIKGFTSWDPTQGTDHDATLNGWTVGAGLEKKINENINARIQYRYSDYGDETWSLVSPPNDVNMGKVEHTNHIFTVGLSYCF